MASSSLQRSGSGIYSAFGPPIWFRQLNDWGITFYIRIDHGGSFHTYPHVGGPFQSLQEADNAIERYLHDSEDQTMFMGPSLVEIAVQQSLYWPDGTMKRRSRLQPIDKVRDWERQLVEALVDKYNEDHNLLGDLAYELKDVVCCQSIHEGDRWYRHINFTAKTKGADDLDCCIDNLFFVEVMDMQQSYSSDAEVIVHHSHTCSSFKQIIDGEFLVSYLCMVEPTDNGNCYGCKNNGSVDMKHPNDAGYIGGHVKGAFLRYGRPKIPRRETDDDDYDLEAEKARLRYLFRGLDDERLMKRMRTLDLPGVAKKGDGVEDT